MTFKQCTENFPLNDTWVGEYSEEDTDVISIKYQTKFTEEDMLFWEDDSCISFVIWDPIDKMFHHIYYGFFPVKGYLTEEDNDGNFYPATYSPDFGWEKVDPFHGEDQIFVPDEELAIELGIPLEHYKEKQWRREIIAYSYDIEAYCNGWIFTSLESLNKFIKENFPAKEEND